MTRTGKNGTGLAALVMGISLAAGLTTTALPIAAFAQTRGPVQRVCKGKVTGNSGAGIKGAVVYLRDGRTSAVRSAITDDDGTYRFVQLTQGTDYDLWAQVDTKKSKTHSISSFDSKNEFNIDLSIDK